MLLTMLLPLRRLVRRSLASPPLAPTARLRPLLPTMLLLQRLARRCPASPPVPTPGTLRALVEAATA